MNSVFLRPGQQPNFNGSLREILELKAGAGTKAKVVGVHRNLDQRDERREWKALISAKMEATLERELVQRLAKATYGDIYSFPEMAYQKSLEQQEEEGTESETEEMIEYVEDLDLEEEEEDDI